MSNFKFNVTTSTQTAGSNKKSDVDWNALNAHVIEAAGTANKARSIPGVISGIYDLGEQNREDAEIDTSDKEWRQKNKDFDGSEESQRKIIAERPASYFKEIDGKLHYCYPQKPIQQVAIAVDFPQVLVDKGKFFGNSNPLPLRMMLNGEFSLSDGTRVVARPYSITEKKFDDGTWAFAPNNGLRKLAEATEILDSKGYFKKERIGELLGKVALFQFRVYMKPSKKDPSKSFFTEEIKLSGIVPEGVNIPEIPEGILHGVNMYGQNDPDAVKQLRLAVKNTIKRANNYVGSDLEKLLSDGEQQNQQPDKKPEQKQPQAPKEVEQEDILDDLPF